MSESTPDKGKSPDANLNRQYVDEFALEHPDLLTAAERQTLIHDNVAAQALREHSGYVIDGKTSMRDLLALPPGVRDCLASPPILDAIYHDLVSIKQLGALAPEDLVKLQEVLPRAPFDLSSERETSRLLELSGAPRERIRAILDSVRELAYFKHEEDRLPEATVGPPRFELHDNPRAVQGPLTPDEKAMSERPDVCSAMVNGVDTLIAHGKTTLHEVLGLGPEALLVLRSRAIHQAIEENVMTVPQLASIPPSNLPRLKEMLTRSDEDAKHDPQIISCLPLGKEEQARLVQIVRDNQGASKDRNDDVLKPPPIRNTSGDDRSIGGRAGGKAPAR